MRIIAGSRRGMKIAPPQGKETTRPISDRVKENLFNILQARMDGAVVLDLFAGTGTLGLEALSRGAEWVTFVEQARPVVDILNRNVEHLRFVESSRVVHGDALHLRPSIVEGGLRDRPGPLVFDLLFVDPPYAMMEDDAMRQRIGEPLAKLIDLGALAASATIVVRHDSRALFQYDWPKLHLTDSRRYGSMALDFLQPIETKSNAEEST
ncbi:MAG: 16S rRNA (guanine(966)-N(2))-methyltransferase RsmD [Anaerolineaceae bacterium]|nr:16S rRNA (guanine(966)-N(2))-methyltransferase RsmD [Anaerolineaceae bacterium]